MLPRLLAAAALAFATLPAPAQVADANLQNLLAGLTSGSEVFLVTPLANGMHQVTSFRPSARMSPDNAAALIQSAREQLEVMGEPQPSTEQIARMLAGGPIELRSGRIEAPGILTQGGQPAAIRSQIVATGTPVPPVGAPSAAAGGSAPALPVATRELALQQLASLGILNPSEDQIRSALVGGTITTVNGTYKLPGILPR